MGFISEIIRQYKELEKRPCVDIKGSHTFGSLERLEHIENELSRSGSSYKVVAGKNNYYKLYAQDSLENLSKEYKEVYLVSAHADNKQHRSSFKHPENGTVHGCGDNASTLAVSLVIMQMYQLPRNILFVATADEEKKCKGAKNVRKKLGKFFSEPGAIKTIVLDVTYAENGYNNNEVDFSFENDYIKVEGKGHDYISSIFNMLNHKGYHWNAVLCEDDSDDNGKYVTVEDMKKYMEKGCVSCNEDGGEDDESAIYKKSGGSAFSFCLPCSASDHNEMHDSGGFDIKVGQYERYGQALLDILKSLS